MGPRGDAIVQFDACVGELLATLDRLELAANTLVILTSDNGPVLDDGYKDDAVRKLGGHRPAGPLRGGKSSIWEGGTRVPFVVRWPARVKPGVSDAIVSQVDLCSTLAALCGQTLAPDDAPDSINVLPALLGDSPEGREHVLEHAGKVAIRKGPWKFIPGAEKGGKPASTKPAEKVATRSTTSPRTRRKPPTSPANIRKWRNNFPRNSNTCASAAGAGTNPRGTAAGRQPRSHELNP